MAINYHKYSTKRNTIMRQVRRVEKNHFKVAEKYHMPTVNELKKMPLSEQRKIIRQSYGFTTSAVRKSAFRYAGVSTKTGKLKPVKVKYSTEVKQSRKIRRKPIRLTEGGRKDIERQAVDYYDQQEQDEFYSFEERNRDKAEVDLARFAKEQPEDFEIWAQMFLDTAPPQDYWNAEQFIEALRNGDAGDHVYSYEEWKSIMGLEPSAGDIFDMKMTGLKTEDPNVADWLQEMYDKYSGAEGEDVILSRLEKAEGGIPDFDLHYQNGEASIGNVLKMARIIKGSALTGAESRALSRALDKDQSMYG